MRFNYIFSVHFFRISSASSRRCVEKIVKIIETYKARVYLKKMQSSRGTFHVNNRKALRNYSMYHIIILV